MVTYFASFFLVNSESSSREVDESAFFLSLARTLCDRALGDSWELDPVNKVHVIIVFLWDLNCRINQYVLLFILFAGVTTWSCVSPKMAIMFTIPLPVLLLIFYALLDKDLITNGNRSGEEHSNVKYTIIGSTSDTHSPDQSVALPEKPPCSEKLRIGLKILPFIIPLFLSFFAEYLSNSSVITSIAFPESHLRPRDHFLFYSLAYRSGKFFGRSYLFIFACLPQDTLEFLSCNKTWVFAGMCLW